MLSLPLLLLLSALYIYIDCLHFTYVISIIYNIYYNLCRTSSAPIDPVWLYMSSLPLLLLLSALYILYFTQPYIICMIYIMLFNYTASIIIIITYIIYHNIQYYINTCCHHIIITYYTITLYVAPHLHLFLSG